MNTQLTGRIHSFQSMGAVDGPGLRFVVFMQGCPLRCAYCHNPDTWAFSAGQEYTVEAVMQKIRRFAPYIKKTGGVTVTGGEPLAQAAFVTALFAALQAEGFHTALDSSGIGCTNKAIEPLLAHTNLVLADVKFLSFTDYRRYTGGNYNNVIGFLQQVTGAGVDLWLRHVVVPGLTDSEQFAADFAQFVKAFPTVKRVELLPFRKLCLEKYSELGIPFPFADVEQAEPRHLEKLKEALGSLAT